MSKKIETVITSYKNDKYDNGGMHCTRTYKSMTAWIDENPYSEAKMYHMVLTGSNDPKVYMETLDRIAEKLRDNLMPCQWYRCFERDEDREDGKSFHMHIFLMIETKDRQPCRQFLNHRKNSKILPITDKRGVKFFIAPPRSPIHRNRRGKQLRYATLAGKAKQDDVKVWISYLVKRRSKVEGMKNIYSRSRDRSSITKNEVSHTP